MMKKVICALFTSAVLAEEPQAAPELSQAWKDSGIPILTGEDYDNKIINTGG
jgi:hypothetical protein